MLQYPVIIELLNFLVFFIFILLSIALITLVERKVMGTMQRRRGPNVVGILGFLQPISDGLKLVLKETIIPKDVDEFVFVLAPVFTFFCSIKVWMVIPFNEFDYSSFSTNGILYLLIIMSLSAYGIIFAGWSSNSKYAFSGGLRSTAQMISYEVCLSFIFLIFVMLSQSIDLREIVLIQTSVWYIYPLLPLWFIFIVCSLAETNRAPFDLPEAEAELVAGYNVEYSAMPFALFFLGEYSNIIAMSALGSVFFFGGWLPLFDIGIIPGSVWFGIKTTIHVFIYVWVRATFPRYRYDQLMKLGWKVLLPLTLLLLFSVSFLFMHIDLYTSLFY